MTATFSAPSSDRSGNHVARVIADRSAIAALESNSTLIHVVWVGSPPPVALERRLADWASINPSATVALWTDEGLRALAEWLPDLDLIRLLELTTNHAATSDVARFAILAALGGIYIDADMEPVRPVTELFALPHGFLARESRWLVVAGAVGLPRGSRFARSALELLAVQAERHGELTNFMGGPPMVTELAKVAARWDEGPEILPSWTFYPVNPFRIPAHKPGPVPPYAIHLYDHTWGEGGELSLKRRLARCLQLVTPRDVAIGKRRPTQLEVRLLARELDA